MRNTRRRGPKDVKLCRIKNKLGARRPAARRLISVPSTEGGVCNMFLERIVIILFFFVSLAGWRSCRKVPLYTIAFQSVNIAGVVSVVNRV